MDEQASQATVEPMKMTVFTLFNANRDGKTFEDLTKLLEVDIPPNLVSRFEAAWIALGHVLDVYLPDEEYFLVLKYFLMALKQFSTEEEEDWDNPSAKVYDSMYDLKKACRDESDELAKLSNDQEANKREGARITAAEAEQKSQIEGGELAGDAHGDEPDYPDSVYWFLRCERNGEYVKRSRNKVAFFELAKTLML